MKFKRIKKESTSDADKKQFKQDWKLLSGMMKGKCKPKGQKEFDNFKKEVKEGTQEDALAMPNRIQEIEDQLKNNAQELYNMLADEYLDNDAKFDELLEERDALVEELCGCKVYAYGV